MVKKRLVKIFSDSVKLGKNRLSQSASSGYVVSLFSLNEFEMKGQSLAPLNVLLQLRIRPHRGQERLIRTRLIRSSA